MARDAAILRAPGRQRLVLFACLGTVAAAGWAWMVAMSPLVGGGVLRDTLVALCTAAGSGWSPAALGAAFAMWAAMTLAMMLPAASPMVATYLDIAEAAREKAIAVPPAALLVAGYVAVWLGFAAAAAVVQGALQRAAALDGGLALANGLVAGAVLIGAGAYQFSALKHACLTKCRQPMGYFLAHWSDRWPRVLAMGLDRGLACLGCCWALMVAMFATGVMNLAWMAALGLVMILERTLARPAPVTRAAGLALAAAGTALIVRHLVQSGGLS